MGFRKGLIEALRKRGLDFALWSERPALKKYRPPQYLCEEFPLNAVELESKVTGWGRFTHVISCVESAVYPASLIRRPLQARLSKDSVILRCHDKLKMKQYLSEFEVPMTAFLPGESPETEEEIFERFGSPVVVKNRKLSGGRGMQVISTPEELKAYRSPDYILEAFVSATESSVESFIHNGQILFQNTTYYRTPGFTNLLPSPQPLETLTGILKLNESVLKSLGIQWGMSHLEVYNTANGPLFGEIALRPPGGYLMELLQYSYGFNAWDIFLSIELGEEVQIPADILEWSASLILHPGEGQIKTVKGLDQVRRLESLKVLSLKKNLQKPLSVRKGVGEEVGHILLSHPDPSLLLQEVQACEREIHFEKSPPSS